VFLSAPNWAIFTVLSKPALARRPPTLVIAYVMLLGWLALLPLFLANSGWHRLPELSLAGWAGLLFLGLFCSGLAYIFWYGALQAADASQVAAFLYLEPLVTLVTAAVVLGEPVTPWTLAGGMAVLAGVWLVNRPAA
jgi:drug/metabolite transporter (DMT)-like permease